MSVGLVCQYVEDVACVAWTVARQVNDLDVSHDRVCISGAFWCIQHTRISKVQALHNLVFVQTFHAHIHVVNVPD